MMVQLFVPRRRARDRRPEGAVTDSRRKRVLAWVLIGLAILVVLHPIAVGWAQEPPRAAADPSAREDRQLPLPVVRTDSPRQTLASFLRLRDAPGRGRGPAAPVLPASQYAVGGNSSTGYLPA